jgi:hypothetical protein
VRPHRPELLIPTASLGRLLDAARGTVTTIDRGPGGQAADIATLGTFGRLIRGAPTLGEALGGDRRSSRVQLSGRVWVDSHGADVELCQVFTNSTSACGRRLLRADAHGQRRPPAAGPAWRPRREVTSRAFRARHDVECLSGTRIERRRR